MKTIAIIPARGGSKRLPNKNLRLLGGLPLIAHSILYAKANAAYIDAVYVSTDDAGIKACALEFGALVIDRPAALSGDHEPTATALKHVLLNVENFANVVLLQPTNPLRPQTLLSDCMKIYLENASDSLFTVSRNHQKLGKIHDQRFQPFNYNFGQRSQDLAPLYFENGLLYITKRELVMQEKVISENAYPFEVEHAFANVDIDTLADFDYACYLFEKFKITNPK